MTLSLTDRNLRMRLSCKLDQCHPDINTQLSSSKIINNKITCIVWKINVII